MKKIKNKKIVFFCSLDLTIESFCKEHILKLAKYNYITVLTKKTKRKNIFNNKKIREVNINFKRNINLFNDIKNFFLIFLFFWKNKFDMIVTITPKAGLLGNFVALISFIKIRLHIFTGQVWSNKKGIFKIFLIICDKLIIMFTTNILFDSKSQFRFVKKKLNLKNNIKSLVINNGSICGVDTFKLKKNPLIRDHYRIKYGIGKRDLVLLYVGRLSYEKGSDLLLKNYELLKEKSPIKIWLFLVGNDEDCIKNNYKNISNLKIFSFTKNLDKFFQISDVFCSFSRREGFGVTAIQASSYSLPVVCSNVYGFKDSVKNNYTGLKFNINNPKQTINKFLKIINDKSLRIKLGINGRKFVRSRFEKKNVIEYYNNYFTKLLKNS